MRKTLPRGNEFGKRLQIQKFCISRHRASSGNAMQRTPLLPIADENKAQDGDSVSF